MSDERECDQAPWMKFAGMVESGDPDSSLRIDEVVYSIAD